MDEETLTVWLDTALLMLGGFILMTILMLAVVNPPAKQSDAEEISLPPGNVIVEIAWPDTLDADVDLWVQAPGDVPVGYSNKGGLNFNLLRDDLGSAQDTTDKNSEIAFSRGMPDGEYVVNVHMYRNVEKKFPVPVNVQISAKASPQMASQIWIHRTVELLREGEEITVYRFRVLGGVLVDHDQLFKELRSAAPSTPFSYGGVH